MDIYYDYKTKKWFQTLSQSSFLLGQSNEEVTFIKKILPHYIPFPVLLKENRIGPLIGILTCQSEKAFTGNIALFKRIQKKLSTKSGGLSIVFTANGITNEGMNGYVFHDSKKCWHLIRAPLPDVIYNRVPFRKVEHLIQNSNVKIMIHDHKIPFFNECFFSKFDIYHLLSSDDFLKPLLPDTMLMKNLNTLEMMIQKYQQVYLKPNEGHQGEGIALIEQTKDMTIHYTSVFESKIYTTLYEFWNEFISKYSSKTFIIQQAIQSDTFEGKRYDLRLFIHFNKGKYLISGIGVRQSGTQSITTHVPSGGNIIPFSTVSDRFNLESIQAIVTKCGHALSQKYGLIGEFSIDMGLSTAGKYYIYELNSKPMVFDEPEIKEKGLENLVSLFQELAHFN